MELGLDCIRALKSLAEESNLSEDVIVASLEAALGAAYRKYREGTTEPEVHLNRETGEVEIYDVRRTTENPVAGTSEITQAEAAQMGYSDVQPGDLVRVPVYVHPEKFGRIAAQTARQVIIQRLKDAEREVVFNEFSEKIGDLVLGEVIRSENDQVLIHIGERSEALLQREERIPNEKYDIGMRLRFFLLDVRQTTRGPRIVLSRTHPGLLRRLMELEIPEIADGTVEIKGIVREAGARAKVAVATTDPSVDPLGACVGASGARIRSISSELCEEKIDIVLWDEDPLTYVKNSLSPATPVKIELVPDAERSVRVFVKPDQLSLAIGKTGQNVRLADRLTGWKLDIQSSEKLDEPAGQTR